MDRVDCSLADVLDATIKLLRQNTDKNFSLCFWSLTATVPTPTPDGLWLCAQPDAGEFDESMMYGGDTLQLTAVTQIIVHIFTTQRLDREGHDDRALFASDRGLLKAHALMLNALAGQDVLVGGRPVLRAVMYPGAWSAPVDLGNNVRSMSQSFRLSFDHSFAPIPGNQNNDD